MGLAYKWQATIVGVIGLFMAVLDNTIVNVALPAMQSDFHTDRTTITWVVTGYFLSQAAVIPITGYLSDRFGTKLVFTLSLAIFTLGSALCGLSPTIATWLGFTHPETALIFARVLQGIGGGALFPVVFAIVFRVFPGSERGPASAVIGIPVLLAPAFGPTIGGYLTTSFTWNAIFFVNVPLGIIGVALAMLILQNRKQELADNEIPTGKGFDIAGLLLSMAGVTTLVYGINKAGEIITSADGSQHARGWTDPTVLGFLIVGAVLLIAWVVVELRSKDPVMDVRLFRNYSFAMSNILTWVLSGVLFGSLFLFPVFFENVQGKSPLSTGEILIPQGLTAALGVIIAGRLYNVFGPRPLIAAGLVLTTIGAYGFTNLNVNTSSTSLQLWLMVRGIGFGLTNIPLQTLAVASISNQAMARASSLINVTRQIFSAIGITLLTTYLIQQTTNHAGSVATNFTAYFANGPAQAAQASCAQQLGANVPAIQQCVAKIAATQGKAYILAHATTLGLNDTFLISMLGTMACIGLALFLGRDQNVQRMKEALRRGENIETQPSVLIGE